LNVIPIKVKKKEKKQAPYENPNQLVPIKAKTKAIKYKPSPHLVMPLQDKHVTELR
jgi:hypothetical protein